MQTVRLPACVILEPLFICMHLSWGHKVINQQAERTHTHARTHAHTQNPKIQYCAYFSKFKSLAHLWQLVVHLSSKINSKHKLIKVTWQILKSLASKILTLKLSKPTGFSMQVRPFFTLISHFKISPSKLVRVALMLILIKVFCSITSNNISISAKLTTLLG